MNPISTTYTIVNLSSVVEILSITLSIIALTITVIGFFASLKFYRDGVQLQDNANKALIQLGEKTQHIQSQVEDIFNKTLDAAIGQKSIVSENFEHINEQIEKTAHDIVDKAIKEIGVAGEKERERLAEIVNKQMEPLRKKIDATRESTEELGIVRAFTQFESAIVSLFIESKKPLKISEIFERVAFPGDICLRAITTLIERGRISLGEKGEIHYHPKIK